MFIYCGGLLINQILDQVFWGTNQKKYSHPLKRTRKIMSGKWIIFIQSIDKINTWSGQILLMILKYLRVFKPPYTPCIVQIVKAHTWDEMILSYNVIFTRIDLNSTVLTKKTLTFILESNLKFWWLFFKDYYDRHIIATFVIILNY